MLDREICLRCCEERKHHLENRGWANGDTQLEVDNLNEEIDRMGSDWEEPNWCSKFHTSAEEEPSLKCEYRLEILMATAPAS